MIQPVTETDSSSAVLQPWRISTERYLEMIRDGVFGPDDKVELINGMIVEMTPANPEHDYSTMRLTELIRPSTDMARTWIQSTVHIGPGQVYDPDFALLKPGRDYKKRFVTADDIFLIAESSNSSLRKDRGAKLKAYARAGIADYWIADVQREVLLVHREPGDGVYGSVQELKGDQPIAPLLLPEFSLRVGDLFD